ncbi:MAG TPA: DUF4268 domain-containing protein [Chitinophagaceae bacterium]
MYTRHEASILRKKFWTSFGQYMRPLSNADGEMINWLNYKTGIRQIHFRMDADTKMASIAIELHHSDPALRMEYFNKFLQLKAMLEESLGESWEWQSSTVDEDGKVISRIGVTKTGVNVFNQDDWPEIISFLKARIIALDDFWSLVKNTFG